MRTTRSSRALLGIAAAMLLAFTLVGTMTSANASSAPADQAKATFIRGVAVKAGNGKPLAGVTVTVRDIGDLSVIGSDVTNSNGVYRIDGLSGDEFAIKFNGRSSGFETGFLACSHAVVPTWAQACSFGTGNLGQARLQRL